MTQSSDLDSYLTSYLLDLQFNLLELRVMYAKLRTKNEKLRQDKYNTERELKSLTCR